MSVQTVVQKNTFKIFLPEEIHTFLGEDVYIGASLNKKRIIIFRREKNEKININNLIFPSVIPCNRCLALPLSLCRYLEWDFSDCVKMYRQADCIIIEPE